MNSIGAPVTSQSKTNKTLNFPRTYSTRENGRLKYQETVVEGLEPDATLVADPRWRSRIQTLPLGPGPAFG